MDDEVANIWVASSDGNIDRVKTLLDEGTDVNAQDENGYSPIHAAASYGHIALIELLVARGANVNLQDSDGDTPILVCEQPEVFELLRKYGADSNHVNNEGESIFDKVVQDENEDMIGYLISNHYITSEEFQEVIKKARLGESLDMQEGDEEDDEEDDPNDAPNEIYMGDEDDDNEIS